MFLEFDDAFNNARRVEGSSSVGDNSSLSCYINNTLNMVIYFLVSVLVEGNPIALRGDVNTSTTWSWRGDNL